MEFHACRTICDPPPPPFELQEENPNFMVVARYLKAVEDLFRKKAINVVFATDSLSLGVNMPIHR